MSSGHPQIFAIDLGTSKFCVARLAESHDAAGGFSIESLAVPARGTKRGMVVDFAAALECLSALIDEAEGRWNCDITNGVAGIAGSHLRSHVAKGSVTIAPQDVVSAATTARLEEQMQSAFAQSSAAAQRDLLDCIAVSYQIDQRDPVDDPHGFSGSVLSADFLMIDSDKAYLRDVVRLVNAAGVKVTRLVSEPLASAYVCAGEDFRDLGCCVVDIGGGTSDGLVFANGNPALAFSVPMAGFAMTSDLSVALNLPVREAERIKTIYGLSAAQMDQIMAEDIHGNQKAIPGQVVASILEARCRELTVHIARNLVPFKGRLGGGILLTGGGSQLFGVAELMASSMRIPVRAVNPKWQKSTGVNGRQEKLAPKFATALGLLVLGVLPGNGTKVGLSTNEASPGISLSGGLMSKLRAWLREMS
ncbi:cell division protein FtsA [bacterium]|nr:cell division protein FtsA [bacterium]